MDKRFPRRLRRIGPVIVATCSLVALACGPGPLDFDDVQVRTGSPVYVLEDAGGLRSATVDVTIHNAGDRAVFVGRLCGFMDQPESRVVDPVTYEPTGDFGGFVCPDMFGPRPVPIAVAPGAVLVDRRDLTEGRRGDPDWSGRFRLTYDITSSADPRSRSINLLPSELRTTNVFDIRAPGPGGG